MSPPPNTTSQAARKRLVRGASRRDRAGPAEAPPRESEFAAQERAGGAFARRLARARSAAAAAIGAVLAPLHCLRRYYSPIKRFTIKEVQTRYRNTYLGLFWFLITPVLYLATFTLVFGYLMPGRAAAWEGVGDGVLAFVLGVFSGLVVFWMFAAVMNQSVALIHKNRHLVSEILFPTEMLAWVVTATALHGLAIHLLFFIPLYAVAFGTLPWLVVALPWVLLPVIFLVTGLGWMLAAVGAIVRDVGQVVQVGVTGLLFVSAVFYPVDIVPEEYRGLFLLNPVARAIQDVRLLLFEGRLPRLGEHLLFLLVGYVFMFAGYRIYKRLQPRFSEYV